MNKSTFPVRCCCCRVCVALSQSATSCSALGGTPQRTRFGLHRVRCRFPFGMQSHPVPRGGVDIPGLGGIPGAPAHRHTSGGRNRNPFNRKRMPTTRQDAVAAATTNGTRGSKLSKFKFFGRKYVDAVPCLRSVSSFPSEHSLQSGPPSPSSHSRLRFALRSNERENSECDPHFIWLVVGACPV